MTIRFALMDSPDAAAYIREQLHLQQDFEMIAELPPAKTSFAKLREIRPDALFVNMANVSPADLDMQESFDRGGEPIVVMLADEESYAAKAFEIGASDYLVKPIQPARFEGTLRRIREQILLRRIAGHRALPAASSQVRHVAARIMVKERKRTQCIDVGEIEWIKAAGDYSEIHVQNSCHLLREPISALIERLPPGVFCRIHRSAVVNMSRVTGYVSLRNNDLLVRLKGKTVLRASRTFSERFRACLRDLERSAATA